MNSLLVGKGPAIFSRKYGARVTPIPPHPSSIFRRQAIK